MMVSGRGNDIKLGSEEHRCVTAKMEKVLVIGEDGVNSVKIEIMLAEYFYRIVRIEERDLSDPKYFMEGFNIILISKITGTEIFSILKEEFPQAKLICLFETPSIRMERSARLAGSVFVGSYIRFGAHYKDILSAAVEACRVKG
jgi:hypothetical protein